MNCSSSIHSGPKDVPKNYLLEVMDDKGEAMTFRLYLLTNICMSGTKFHVISSRIMLDHKIVR